MMYVEIIKNVILTLMFSIVIHEFGHLMVFRYIGKKVIARFDNFTFKVGREKDYAGLPLSVLFTIYAFGISIGILAILIFALPETRLFILITYLTGCRTDLYNIYCVVKTWIFKK